MQRCGICGDEGEFIVDYRCDKCYTVEKVLEKDPGRAALVMAARWPKVGGNFADVRALHEKFDLPRSDVPRAPDRELFMFRSDFMRSELQEFTEAYYEDDLVKMADSLLDLVYVALGTAVAMGVPWQACWGHVHRANMAKHRADAGTGYKHGLGKPEGWQSPNERIAGELRGAGWRQNAK